MFGDMRLFEAGEAGFGGLGEFSQTNMSMQIGWFGGVFTDKHVDANCRTVNLMFFSSCRTSDW